MHAKNVFETIWDSHVIERLDDDTSLLYIDRVFLHEKSGAFALTSLTEDGRHIYEHGFVWGTLDHSIDTRPDRGRASSVPETNKYIEGFRQAARSADIPFFDVEDRRQGICHVTFPEQGLVLPGMTAVCADSHTGTLGGLGAIALGVGITTCETVLATHSLPVRRPRTLQARFNGEIPDGVYAKDLVLALIGQIGAGGAVGFAIEYAGTAVQRMSVEGRMTLCNMAVEAGATTGIVSPDEAVLSYLHGRPLAPRGDQWEAAAANWRALASGESAPFDRAVDLSVTGMVPQITWGTSPAQVCGIDGRVPAPSDLDDSSGAARALSYMGLEPGIRMGDIPVDGAFIGSCTNARIGDLRAAATLLVGKKVAKGVRAVCTPGSTAVRLQAEQEGIAEVFRHAGFEWRQSGCGFCFHAGGDGFRAGSRVVSSTNRNFEGRQGPGVRTHLASPATVAASAVNGRLTDPRELT